MPQGVPKFVWERPPGFCKPILPDFERLPFLTVAMRRKAALRNPFQKEGANFKLKVHFFQGYPCDPLFLPRGLSRLTFRVLPLAARACAPKLK